MDIYSLTDGKYIDALSSVDNSFVRQLYGLAVKSGENKKILGVITKKFMSSNDDMAKNTLNGLNKGILNICNLTPLQDKENCKTLVEDIAKYRWKNLGFDYDEDYWKERSDLLFLDYILSCCLCYVEVFDKGGSKGNSNLVEKFYATRNRFIAANIAKVPHSETSKYVNYLMPVLSDYKMENLRVLKLSRQKKGFKITQPRSAINFSRAVRVTPLFFIGAFMKGLMPLLNTNIVKFTYVKDNGQERELITTLSKSIFEKYYDKTYAENAVKGCELKLDRGYLRVPELGCSKYDESGLRAVNLSRITNIEIIDDIDSSYIEVDFNSIIPTFKAVIESVRNEEILRLVYQTLMNVSADNKSIAEMRSEIMIYVDGRFAIGTSTFQKELHNYMLQYNMVFKNYTGKPMKYALDTSDSFNLGFEE